jgi:mannose-6-phosphate isomerase-like protein (cupin superfamily)
VVTLFGRTLMTGCTRASFSVDILEDMNGFLINIEEESLKNGLFRKVLYTAKNCQLVLMSIAPGQDIGEEVHQLDQFIRCEKGKGKTVLNGAEHEFTDGWIVLVPAGVRHNIVNLSQAEPLQLYTVYAPPNHKDGTVHATKEDAESDEEAFDGVTTE